MDNKNYTWEELVEMKSGHVIEDDYCNDIRYLIMRGPSSLTAYLGIPMDHTLAGKTYDEIPLRVHGGLTFSAFGKEDDWRPEGFYWIGWDYSHCDDYAFYYDTSPIKGYKEYGHKWMVDEVRDDVFSASYDLKVLLALFK